MKIAADPQECSSSMSYKIKCIIYIITFFLSIYTYRAAYDLGMYHPEQQLHLQRTTIGRPGYAIHDTIPRETTIKPNEFIYPTNVSEGDVDVAIFTIRENRAKLLPTTFHCSKWNRSITYRNARFNTSACRKADVVMFTSGKDFERREFWTELQAQRTIDQIWVLSSPETAINTIGMFPPIFMKDIKFNLSSTFDPDSDIPMPYGKYIPFSEKIRIPFRSKLLNDTTKFAVWVASHCPLRTWNRSGIVSDISRYIPVDVYGACGNLTCHPKDRKCNTFRPYKFHLSLENSCCANYITEKLWEPLTKYESIPVVLGARKEDYEKVAPPNSFIHIDDFASVKHLADYLKNVASNVTLYRSYFEWRNFGYVRWRKLYRSVWESEEHSCRLLEYVKGVRPLPRQGFDPYGPKWLSGCSRCGTQSWLDKYYLHPFKSLYESIR